MSENVVEKMKPDSIRIGEVAIAASAAGYPMTVKFKEFPAVHLVAVWRYHAERLGPHRSIHVSSAKDLRRMERSLDQLRLILVSQAPLYLKIVWSIALASTASPPPTIFSTWVDCDRAEDPSTSIVMHPRDGEDEKIAEFLNTQPAVDAPQAPSLSVGPVSLDPALVAALDRAISQPSARRAARSLLVGLYALERGAVNLQHVYTQLFEILHCPLLRTAEEPFDPIARDMVNRANVYLRAYSQGVKPPKRVARIDNAGGGGNKARDVDYKITRRELVDLGIPRGRTVRELIERLLGTEDGYRQFVTMGLQHIVKDQQDWPVRDARALAKLLTSWSEKQVRTHFHRLHVNGLITARKVAANGAWEYQIPEVFGDMTSVFGQIPHPESLSDLIRPETESQAGRNAGVPGLPPASPNEAANQTKDILNS